LLRVQEQAASVGFLNGRILDTNDNSAPVLLGRDGDAAGQSYLVAKQAVGRMALDLLFRRLGIIL
jgi:hypothetical protein